MSQKLQVDFATGSRYCRETVSFCRKLFAWPYRRPVTYANAHTHAGMEFKCGAVCKFRPVKTLLPSKNYAALSVLMWKLALFTEKFFTGQIWPSSCFLPSWVWLRHSNMRSAFAYVTKIPCALFLRKIYQFLGSCCKILIPWTKVYTYLAGNVRIQPNIFKQYCEGDTRLQMIDVHQKHTLGK